MVTVDRSPESWKDRRLGSESGMLKTLTSTCSGARQWPWQQVVEVEQRRKSLEEAR